MNFKINILSTLFNSFTQHSAFHIKLLFALKSALIEIQICPRLKKTYLELIFRNALRYTGHMFSSFGKNKKSQGAKSGQQYEYGMA